jgi:hypothetical protein
MMVTRLLLLLRCAFDVVRNVCHVVTRLQSKDKKEVVVAEDDADDADNEDEGDEDEKSESKPVPAKPVCEISSHLLFV